MGGNGSYDKKLGGVPKKKRTHIETSYTVMGHKVLLQKGIEYQTKNILNANSPDSTYLIAKLNDDSTLTILNYCCPIKVRSNVDSIKIGGQT